MINLLFDNNTDFNFKDEYLSLSEKVMNEVLKLEGVKSKAEISFSLVNNSEIRQINNQFRSIDRETDVLSFPLIDFTSEGLPDFSCTNEVILGDIILSIDKTTSQAEEYGHSFERELGFLIAHSMLHLLGYDHMDEESEKIMISKQEEVLNNLNLKRF